MRNTPQAMYDRYLVPITCDRCDKVATWTLRYRYPGTGWMESHACNRHRKHAEARIGMPLIDGAKAVAVQRIARTAF